MPRFGASHKGKHAQPSISRARLGLACAQRAYRLPDMQMRREKTSLSAGAKPAQHMSLERARPNRFMEDMY